MDFLNRLKDFLESLEYTPSKIEIGAYNKNSNSIAIVPSPSNIVTRYMEGKLYPFNFQLLIHHKNNLSAYDISQKIFQELDEKTPNIQSATNSFILVSMQNATTFNYVQETEYGALWSGIFEAELYITKTKEV